MNWIKSLFDDGSVDMRKPAPQPAIPVIEFAPPVPDPKYCMDPSFVIAYTGTSLHPHVASAMTCTTLWRPQ
jgi:hypothetical protein